MTRRLAVSLLFAATLIAGCTLDTTLARAPADAGGDTQLDALDARGDGAGDGAADGAGFACPASRLGAGPMVDLGGFCVDLAEVTKARYAAWLASTPSTSGQLPQCGWNLEYAPAIDASVGCTADANDATKYPELPVVCVDWCDAFAYCAAVGKHLCGQIGGGSDGFPASADDVLADPVKSEWFAACTGVDRTSYPYGDTYDGALCNGKDYGLPTPMPIAVGTATRCHGRGGTLTGGVFDLSGNVAEWTNSCQAYVPGGVGDLNSCVARGGWFGTGNVADFACSNVRLTQPRSRKDNHIGFRCCG